ncbi:MAG: branched-chain amino acid ABC transporter permease [Anaerolineae bacterium]|nr:branched-chain amino acid ABC transporter permease [Anaerolineae bacterium]MDW8072463.1 branched-chain amino acid ABC transporter permease [Anaerolineae bacterium]
MEIFVQLLVNGVIAGGTYALAAVGYSMVYGALKFINFAHGSIAMVGAYITFVLVMMANVPLVPAFLGSMLLTAMLGVMVERVAYRPLRRAPKLASLTTAIAVSFVLDAAVMIVMGADIRTFSLTGLRSYQLGPIYITPVQGAIILTSLVFMVGLYWLLTRTKLGKAIRAVADGISLAEVSGIDTNLIISAVFAIGSALAAASGALIGMDTNLQPTMGFIITVKAFAAVVLGGLGNVWGAVVGAFLIGIVENTGVWFIPPVWKDSIAYGILILVLFLRPSGIFGKKGEVQATVL